ncbi:MAG: hypothetical protein K8T91_04750 [Planctomycetes bacterium]|nr:hypothetical protein [Planctomycetota bacterium]
MPIRLATVFVAIAVLLALTSTSDARAADPAAAETLSLADGKVTLTTPTGWVKKEPKFRGIALYEFAVPKAEGDAVEGRVTVGQAGGDIEANQQRWLGQFVQPDGSKTADRAKRSEKEVAGAKVRMLDVSGTYVAPPFSGGGKFPDYRMLAAIVVTPKHGSWYVRLYGPEKTVAQQVENINKMIDGLKIPAE